MAPGATRRPNLENLIPARSLPAGRQPLGPELVQLQLAPQLTREPARAPLPRPAQRQCRETNTNRRGVVDRRAAILRNQRQCSRLAGRLVEYLDRLAPRRGLRRADLSQIQDLPLHHPAVVEVHYSGFRRFSAFPASPNQLLAPTQPRENRRHHPPIDAKLVHRQTLPRMLHSVAEEACR
jgi:hypothetical protein